MVIVFSSVAVAVMAMSHCLSASKVLSANWSQAWTSSSSKERIYGRVLSPCIVPGVNKEPGDDVAEELDDEEEEKVDYDPFPNWERSNANW